jgi:hypothetical protein
MYCGLEQKENSYFAPGDCHLPARWEWNVLQINAPISDKNVQDALGLAEIGHLDSFDNPA